MEAGMLSVPASNPSQKIDRYGFRIHQVPVTHRRRRHGRQSGANPRVILRALVELAKLYRELHRPRSDGALLDAD